HTAIFFRQTQHTRNRQSNSAGESGCAHWLIFIAHRWKTKSTTKILMSRTSNPRTPIPQMTRRPLDRVPHHLGAPASFPANLLPHAGRDAGAPRPTTLVGYRFVIAEGWVRRRIKIVRALNNGFLAGFYKGVANSAWKQMSACMTPFAILCMLVSERS